MNYQTIIVLLVILIIIYNLRQTEGFEQIVQPKIPLCPDGYEWNTSEQNCIGEKINPNLVPVNKKCNKPKHFVCQSDSNKCCRKDSVSGTCQPGNILSSSAVGSAIYKRCCPNDKPKYKKVPSPERCII